MSSAWNGTALWWGVCLTGAAAIATAAVYVIFGPESLRGKVLNCPGLMNLGNTCFINAVVQALSSTPPITRWLSHYCTNPNNHLARSLYSIIQALNEGIEGEIAPKELLDALLRHGWLIDHQQQDALEFYHVLLSTIEEEMTEPSGSLSDILSVPLEGIGRTRLGSLSVPPPSHFCPFRGLLTSTLICCHCNNRLPTRYEYIDSLSLPVQSNILNTSTSLDHCLKNYMTSEVVQDVECPSCSTLTSSKCKRQFLKRLCLGRPPEVLCINFMRAVWTGDGSMAKNVNHVTFPLMLNISSYLSSSYKGSKYQLLAVIEHLGGPASGHYCTYRRHNGQWIYTSDLTVYPVYISEVLNAQAYMLFYQKMK